jgi:phosphoribosyl 1,2-cyclic phosphodiesterase
MLEIKCLASGSSGNCYKIDDGKTPLLLEAGIPWKLIQQRLDFQTAGFAGCLISHSHGDHSKAVKDAVKAGLDCYMSAPTAEAIGITSHRIRFVEAKRQFVIGTWTVMPFQVEHDAEGALGFLLASRSGDRLLYLTDTAYTRYLFKGLTHIMVECNYSLDILRRNVDEGLVLVELKNRLLKTHMSLETVKGFLRANDLSRVREIHLLHLSDGNSDQDRFKREIQALTGKPVYVAG